MNEGVRTSELWEGKYTREAIRGRLLQLSGSARERLDLALNDEGSSYSDACEWPMKPAVLDDDKVEAVAREIAPALAELKLAGEDFDAKAYEYNPKEAEMINALKAKAKIVADILLSI